MKRPTMPTWRPHLPSLPQRQPKPPRVARAQAPAAHQASGRFWAYVGTIFGVTMSSFANLIETLTNPDVPHMWQRVAAGFFGLLPVGLFVSLEVLVRNRVKEHLNWWRAAMFITALAFAVPSYLHMHWLLQDWKQGLAISIITPIGWDGMMLLSTLALLLDPTKPAPRPPAAPPAPQRAEPVVGTPTVTQRPPTRQQADTERRRLASPADHPLFAEWMERRGTAIPLSAKEMAARTNVTEPAARSMLNRWAKADPDPQPQPEVETSRQEINA